MLHWFQLNDLSPRLKWVQEQKAIAQKGGHQIQMVEVPGLIATGVIFCYRIFCFRMVRPLIPLLSLLRHLCVCEKLDCSIEANSILTWTIIEKYTIEVFSLFSFVVSVFVFVCCAFSIPLLFKNVSSSATFSMIMIVMAAVEKLLHVRQQ